MFIRRNARNNHLFDSLNKNEIERFISKIGNKECRYFLFMSIYCSKCINILAGYHKFREKLDKSMLIIMDCSEEEYIHLREMYQLDFDIILTGDNKAYEKMNIIKTPILIKNDKEMIDIGYLIEKISEIEEAKKTLDETIRGKS